MNNKSTKLLLAPMQDVTNLAFWHCVAPRGGPDIYVTEYFRVHPESHLERFILDSIEQNPTGKPVIAQMIGNDAERLSLTARQLHDYDIFGIDMNLGCPAPSVCGKECGGALLKSPDRIREIVNALRPVVKGTLTLKTRVGYESPDEFDRLLDLFATLPIDGLSIHGRTVQEKYQSLVHTEKIAEAAANLPYPVYANGSMVSVASALGMLRKTDVSGLMIGRGAIRNPWIFQQVRQALSHEPVFEPQRRDVLDYVQQLFDEVGKTIPRYSEKGHVQRIKRFMNYIAVDIDEGAFLHDIRRIKSANAFNQVCCRYLDQDGTVAPEPETEGKLFCGFKELAT